MSSAVFWSHYDDNGSVWIARDGNDPWQIEYRGSPDWRIAFQKLAEDDFKRILPFEGEPDARIAEYVEQVVDNAVRAARRAERERIAAFVQALPEFDEHRNGFSDLIDRNEAATAIRALGDE
jgi:acyl-CoA reductase-like NAD-dependent aldehyde dehydrogenase